jgi:hypothetical protein
MHDNKEQVTSKALIMRTTNTKAEFFFTPSFKEAEEFKFANKYGIGSSFCFQTAA